MWYRPKEPYEPWKILESEFPKDSYIESQLKFILKYAVLAPSTFNVQPWLFSISKNKIIVRPDFNRTLRTSDKDNRLLYISLGCAIKNLEIAAEYFGFSLKREFVESMSMTIIELSFQKNGRKISKPLINAIKNRLTNRNPYEPRLLPKSLLEGIKQVGDREGLSILILTGKSIKREITSLVEKGDMIMWNDKEFKEEHLRWVRHNLTTQHDGMPAYSVGIPLIASFFAEFAIKYLPYAKIQSRKNKFLLSTTPYFVFILSKNHDKETWVKVGECLEEIWLGATESGVSLAPLAQVHAIGNIHEETKKVLKTNLFPQFFFRLGYSTKRSYNSPRRKVEEVLIDGV